MRRIKSGSQERARGNVDWDEHFAVIVGSRATDEAAEKSGKFSLDGFHTVSEDASSSDRAIDEGATRAPSEHSEEPVGAAGRPGPAPVAANHAQPVQERARRERVAALPLRLSPLAGGVAAMAVVMGAVGIAATLLPPSAGDGPASPSPASPSIVADIPKRPAIVRETAEARLPTLAEVLRPPPEQAPRPVLSERPAIATPIVESAARAGAPTVRPPDIEAVPPAVIGSDFSGPAAWVADAPVPDTPASAPRPVAPAATAATAPVPPAVTAQAAEPPVSSPADLGPDAVVAAVVEDSGPPGDPPMVLATEPPPRPDPSPRVITVQRALLRDGIDPGPVDGLFGPRTREAIRTYQARAGMEPTGLIDPALLRRLASGEPSPVVSADAAVRQAAHAEPLRVEPLRAQPGRAEPMIEIPRPPAAAARQQAMARPDTGPPASPPSPDGEPDPDGYGLVEALGDLFGLPPRTPVLASRGGPDGPGGDSGTGGDEAGGGSSGSSGAGSGGSDSGGSGSGDAGSGSGPGSDGSGSGAGSGGAGSGGGGAGSGSAGGSAGGNAGDGDAADSGDDSSSGGIGGAVGGAVGGVGEAVGAAAAGVGEAVGGVGGAVGGAVGGVGGAVGGGGGNGGGDGGGRR